MFDKTRASFNALMLLMFLTSIGVGSLFLVALEYLGGAVWSTPFRRISEFLASIVLILPIVAIPVYLGLHELYHWTHLDVVAADKILSGKAAYLNEGFFTIRVAAYFLIWILFYYLITNNSKKQDTSSDQKLTKKNIKLSAGFMPLFAISITFGSIDWMMSLEPHWFSTIYGVYYFSGTVLASLAALTYAMVYLNEKGYFGDKIKKDHYYSFGALMFGFVNFWAYIAFSQLILIWYANLPEETFWFMQRWEGEWMYVSLLFMVAHFIVPYFGLLAQPSKMNPKRLKFMSLWILFAHYFDMYWLVMPTMSKGEAPFSWIELGFPLLAVGIILIVFNIKSSKNNLMPVGDPKLKRGLDFRF
ncbi:MAG: quinol:cytochrome C oxidoreductase [Melioribacteraceae bacterium]|nr:quinol:cytochrome C oxidoreductase [Melioribacteraceae bacterium]